MKKKYFPLDFRSFFKLLIVSSFFFLINSCTDNDSSGSDFSQGYVCATCKTSPEALAVNDNSSKGIYIGFAEKGILEINIDNNRNGIIKAFLLKDKVKKNLIFLESYSDSERYYALFADNTGDPISLRFSVMHNGNDPQILLQNEIVYKTSNFVTTIFKEKSNNMIEVFEGKLLKKNVLPPIDLESSRPQLNGEDSDPIHPINEEIGHEIIVLSRSKGIWSEMRSISYVIYDDVATINIKNSGLIRGRNLIDNENKRNGTLNSDLISGSVFSESNDLSINLKRVL
jgi:hypothetical protein